MRSSQKMMSLYPKLFSRQFIRCFSANAQSVIVGHAPSLHPQVNGFTYQYSKMPSRDDISAFT